MTTPSHPRPDRWRDVTPDDRAHDDAAHEFWGDQADWSTPVDRVSDRTETDRDTLAHDQTGGTRAAKVGRWWGSLLGGGSTATRTHSADESRPQPLDDDGLDDWPDSSVDNLDLETDDESDERWETASGPTPAPRSGVDPLLARFGGIAVIVTLLVPVFLGFASDSNNDETVRTESAPQQIPALATSTADGPAADSASGQPAPAPTLPAPTSPAAPPSAAPSTVVAVPASSVATTTPVDSTVPMSDTQAQALTAPGCAVDYDVVAGDFWIRLADESGTSLADVLDVNDATLDTTLFPGESICLPAGADIPAPPTTSAPTTTNPPVAANPRPVAVPPTTSRPATTNKTAPTTTNKTAPTTTKKQAPTTTPVPAPPAVTASPAEVQAIIRAVWPDELEGRAIEIAQRESSFIPTARNSCCLGVFQVYWSVHKSWLAGIGITSAEQLYDPALNARAALALYERAGGWGPWGF